MDSASNGSAAAADVLTARERPDPRSCIVMFDLLFELGARGSDAKRIGRERNAFDARQRNRRSTPGNRASRTIHEACAAA
jgi:hypothetical protein